VRVIAAITRVLEKIFRSVAGDGSMHVGLESVVAEIILRVWFKPITHACLDTLVNMARNVDIQVMPPHHGIGIGIRPRMKDRIRANGRCSLAVLVTFRNQPRKPTNFPRTASFILKAWGNRQLGN
jgi:hypothetical protein